MRKSYVFYLTIVVLAVSAVFFACARRASAADTLTEIREQFALYQSEPQARAKEIGSELQKIRDVEDGLARQYDVKVSDIIEYEYQLEWLVDTYYSMYLIQKRGDARNTFILEDAEISRLAERKPPYPFAFYVSVMNSFESCSREYASEQGSLDYAKKKLSTLRPQRSDIEREYRLAREKTLLSTENRVRYSFDLLVLKAKLERAIADTTFYEHTQKLAQNRSVELKGKIDALTPILKNIRANLKPGGDNFEKLDAIAFSATRRLRTTIKDLDKKFDDLSVKRREAVDPTPFMKYWMLTEQDLTENEILFTLDLVENWAAMRGAWRSLEDLILDKLSVAEKKNLRRRTEDMIAETNESLDTANEEIQRLRIASTEAERKLSAEDDASAQEDEQLKEVFLNDLETRRMRYLDYIVMLGAMKTQFETLKDEVDRLLGEAHATDKLSDMLEENKDSLLNYELWNIGDYPITVRKIAMAAVIFLLGLGITKFAVTMIKRRYMRRPSISPHSALLFQKFIFYLGIVLSFLMALWILHIPLTAFAFMGGAAAIAIGLGTQKMMGDTLSGILLLFQKKVRIGDQVIIGSVQGIVTEISLQNTVLLCEQSKHMIIPNSKVLESSVMNLTLNDTVNRTEVTIGVACGSDMDKVAGLIKKTLAGDSHILKTPPFRIVYTDVESSGIEVTVIFFIDIDKDFESDVKSEVRMNLTEAFIQNGVKLSVSQSELRIVE